MKQPIKTCEEDSGLWSVRRGGELLHIRAIKTAPRKPGQRPGYMPLQLFDLSLDTIRLSE